MLDVRNCLFRAPHIWWLHHLLRRIAALMCDLSGWRQGSCGSCLFRRSAGMAALGSESSPSPGIRPNVSPSRRLRLPPRLTLPPARGCSVSVCTCPLRRARVYTYHTLLARARPHRRHHRHLRHNTLHFHLYRYPRAPAKRLPHACHPC